METGQGAQCCASVGNREQWPADDRGVEVLAAALDNRMLPPDAAKVALRTLDASGRQIPALSEALTKAGGPTR